VNATVQTQNTTLKISNFEDHKGSVDKEELKKLDIDIEVIAILLC
jgi:hypothetical protein